MGVPVLPVLVAIVTFIDGSASGPAFIAHPDRHLPAVEVGTETAGLGPRHSLPNTCVYQMSLEPPSASPSLLDPKDPKILSFSTSNSAVFATLHSLHSSSKRSNLLS